MLSPWLGAASSPILCCFNKHFDQLGVFVALPSWILLDKVLCVQVSAVSPPAGYGHSVHGHVHERGGRQHLPFGEQSTGPGKFEFQLVALEQIL